MPVRIRRAEPNINLSRIAPFSRIVSVESPLARMSCANPGMVQVRVTPTPGGRDSLEFRLQPVWIGFRLKPSGNDARYQGKVSVWYPFHPFYGMNDLSVARNFGCRDVEYVELVAPKARQAVPSWMLDQERCAQMTCGLQPAVDLAALLDLADWLQAQGL